VFTIDTGRCRKRTYDVVDKYRTRYGINVEVFMPDTAVVQADGYQTRQQSFLQRRQPATTYAARLRKVLPLRRALMNYSAWVTGLRRDQWATRSNIRKIEIDHDHGGIVKLAPLADWQEEEVWNYIRANDVPYNELYDKAISPSDARHARAPWPKVRIRAQAGWCWETGAPKECGMHCAIETGGFEHELASAARPKTKAAPSP